MGNVEVYLINKASGKALPSHVDTAHDV